MIIEYQIPDELLARCAGQASICKKVLQKFIEQMQNDLPSLKQYLIDNDAGRAAKLAHRIKGASANVVATDIREAATQIESFAGNGNIAQATELLDDLETAWRQHEELTSNFLSQ